MDTTLGQKAKQEPKFRFYVLYDRIYRMDVLEVGVDIVTVKELLGHSNISTTMRYAHSNDEAKRMAVQRLAHRDKVVAIVPRNGKVAV